MAPVATWPRFITASKWSTAWQAAFSAARKKRGVGHATDGTMVPRITNAEAITLIQAWSEAATPTRFPLWYQFAAVAYGWSVKRDSLNTSSKQGAALYPLDITHELWLATFRLASDLDDAAPTNPRLNMDGTFDDVVYQASVRLALTQDGAKASWVIGFGGCKDENGNPSGKPRKNKDTGKWECDPVIINDPASGPVGNLFAGILILGALWVVLTGDNK